jgi:NMT1/THI5 like protein
MKLAFIGLSVILEHLKKSAHYSMMLLFLILSTTNAPAESTNVKIMMDWVIGSTHAPFFIAQDKGYYRANGVTVDSIDAGRGATNVAVSVAGGLPVRLGRFAVDDPVQRPESSVSSDRSLHEL